MLIIFMKKICSLSCLYKKENRQTNVYIILYRTLREYDYESKVSNTKIA